MESAKAIDIEESNKLDGNTNYNVWKLKARAVLRRENM